jgi:tRNA pseudouridine55 synthase
MLLGRSTKESSRLAAQDKEYAGAMFLGATSDTGDRTGNIVTSGSLLKISRHDVEAAFSEFTGEMLQMPPMYSAVKVNGTKMYELARRGIEAKRQPRKVVIRSLEITAFDIPVVAFEVACSKGTYIRQLAADIGARLGCGAYLEELRRTRCGSFGIKDARSLDELKKMRREELGKMLVQA